MRARFRFFSAITKEMSGGRNAQRSMLRTAGSRKLTQDCATNSATLRVNSARDPPIFVQTAQVAGSALASRGLANYNQAAIDRDEIE
jgi:hypothetical protein